MQKYVHIYFYYVFIKINDWILNLQLVTKVIFSSSTVPMPMVSRTPSDACG